MSLTSYRAAPPRVKAGRSLREDFPTCVSQTWQRPTLPRLRTKYHQRWGVSRPCSEWERVQPPRQNHQVSEAHVVEKLDFRACHRVVRWARRMRTIKPNERLVPVSFMRCRTSTPGLSTWWSSTALQGEIVLREASRLDAFSGYPVRI